MRKSARILFTLAALAVAVSPVAGKDDEVNFKYDKLLKKSFDELGDGSIVPVTVETATEIDGTMSADGQYMFYSSDRERGNFDIYLRSMTDITTVRVTSHPSKDVSPAVSRDGRRLAFVSFREDPLGDIYVMDTDPASMIESASDPDAESFDSKAANISMIRDARGTVQAFRDADPAWSPDGKNVVFSSTRNGSENLFICDREGKNLRQLTTKGGTTPRYSEDGSAIVFVSYRDNASGEIYVLNPASGKETRVTDEPGVKLYPSFGKTTAEISYTLIDADTNKDGKIDFKDRSVLMYMNTARKISYQLTLGSVSSFRGRFFPSFPLSYTTKEVNYQGVILYSEQSGNNININIIPEYGVIPKRKTEELQYSLAEDYAANQEATDRVILSYLRVYQFNPVSNNPSPVAVRALFRAAIGYRETGDMKSAAAVASKLRSLSKNEDDYCGVKARILDETLAGKDPGALYQKGVSLVTDAKNASFMKEDAADYRLSKGDSVKAGSLYRSIVESDEKFRNIAAVKYQLGLIESGKGTSIPSTLVDVFKIGRQTQKDKASLAIVSILAREKNARKRIGVIEDFRTRLSGTTDEKDKTVQAIQPVLAYAEGVAFVEAGDSVKGAEWFQKAIASLRTTELMYYEANLRMAEISAKKGDTAGEEKHLSLIANNYLPRWNRSDFGSVINRLIAYYENTGANLESTGKYDKAAELYTRYINMLTYLHLKKKFEDVYNEYAPRAHVLYIDSFAQSKSDMFDALSILEKQYLGRLPIARLDFDKAFIYGLGYIYAKRGAEQERQLDEGALTVTEGAFTESYLSAQNHLAWAFFMDDTFVDPYLLQGWMNQAIDLRRVKLQNQNAAYKLWKLNKSFPPYLWERNKSVYEKGIEAADASKFPDKSGSLHLNLGNTYFLLSNYPLALEHYEAAARLKKGFGSRKEESLFRYHLSYCYWQTGKTAEAKREMLRVYDAYSQLASTSTGRQYAEQLTNIDEYMAMYERTLGNYNESIKWHERAIADGGDRLRSDLSRITLEIAWCAMKAGDYPRAYRICSKAEEMLSREPSDDQEFILRLYLFHVIGINFYDLGPDKVVIGDSRIFSHLSVTQKKLFLSSIREELGMRKGDYAAVSAAVNEKIAILKGRTTDADKDALIRAYNGIGNSLFRLGRYSEARNYFEKGWQFATDPEVNNLRGAFISVKNSVSLYGFILENSPELIADPAGELALLDKRINGFQTGYEDARYAEMKAAIDEEAEARDKPVDPAKLAQAKAAAAEEAKQVCADLDASRAVIDFYRAEFVPADGNTDPMKAFRDAMTAREMYLRAGAVFESSLQAVEITVPRRIKLYMNAALCREKTGYARKAYELLGKAEKLASDSKRDDLLWEMYYREALFLLNSGKEVEENSAKLADNYFRKAMAVVENIPSLYADSPRVTRMYRDYRDTLIARGDYKEALSAYAKALSMERIASASRMMALSSDAAMKDDVSSYLSLTVKLRDAKRALSDFIDSGSTDAASRKTIEANIDSVRKEIADKASDIRTRDASAYSLVVSGRDDLSSVSGKVIIMISRYGDDAVIWKIGSGEGPAARVRLSDTDKIMSLMSGNVSQDAKRYVIMDDDAFAVMDGIPSRGLPFTWAPSINWIRTSGDSRKESPSTVATYGRDVSASKMPDIMICPDTDSVESLTAGNGVSPVIIVFPQSGVSKMRWLAESALMNGARSAVFIPATKIAAESGVFRTAAGRVSSIQNGSDMRIAGYDDEMVRGADTRAVSVYYEHEMIAALSRGDATGALTASLRYDAVTASSGATASKSALARAKAAEMTDSPSAVDYARNAAASGSADAVSYLIYALLNRGNVSDADVALKSAKIVFAESTMYAAVIDAMKTGKSLSAINVPDNSAVDAGRLQLLLARYRALNGEKPVIGRMKPLSYPLSASQSFAAMRFGAGDIRGAGDRASLLKSIAGTDGPVSYETVEKSSKADDTLSTVALTLACEKGISGGNFIRFIRNVDMSRIRPDADVLISLDFYENYRSGCRRANIADTASKALDAEIRIAASAGFTRIADNALIERASKSINEGKYDAASADLAAASRTINGSGLETKHRLMSAEVALMKGDVSGGEVLLSGVKPESPVDDITADLLRAYGERLKILSLAAGGKNPDVHTSPAVVAGFARYEMFMKRVLSRMDSRTVSREGMIRRDLLEKGIDFLVSINHLKNDVPAALLYEEIKRQIDRWDSSGAGDGKLITSVDIAGFKSHVPADSVAVYISRNEDDIFAWVISREKITPVRIPGGYLNAKDFKTRYSVALRQMQNVYPYSVELEKLLAPAFRSVWKMKRVYIIPDKYTEPIPFEIMAKEKMLAEQVEMCYLSSIATLSYDRTVPRMRAVISGGSSEIDSIALARAGMTAKKGDAGFAHVVIRASLVDGSIVSSDDGREIIRGDRYSVIYLSRGVAGSGMTAVAPAAGRYGASAVIIASTSVRDVNNVVFAENFYTRFRKGENLMSAFSSAMRTTAGMTDYAHPAYWAGTRLYMNGLE